MILYYPTLAGLLFISLQVAAAQSGTLENNHQVDIDIDVVENDSAEPQPVKNKAEMASEGESSSDDDTAGEGNFALLVVADQSPTWLAIRYDRSSGKSWEHVDNAWVRVRETKAFKPGSNARFIVKSASFAGSQFVAIRMNEVTGETWFLSNRRWLPIPVFEE